MSNLLKFLYKQRFQGFEVPSTPAFDSIISTEWFVSRLRESRMYVEFGSGGSTCLAAKLRIPFVTIDSDRYFLESVRAKLETEGLHDPSIQVFRHVDIGLTKAWGKPVMLTAPSRRRIDRFRMYSEFPSSDDLGMPRPDLVLVDGRFRVACTLKACRALRGTGDWLVIVDDYADKPHYHVVEEFAALDRHVGRMGVFRGLLDRSAEDLDKAIASFETDPR